jgi:hypothetical protein
MAYIARFVVMTLFWHLRMQLPLVRDDPCSFGFVWINAAVDTYICKEPTPEMTIRFILIASSLI